MQHKHFTQINEAILSGEKYDWISAKYGVSKQTIKNYRKKLGLPRYRRTGAGEKVEYNGRIIYACLAGRSRKGREGMRKI